MDPEVAANLIAAEKLAQEAAPKERRATKERKSKDKDGKEVPVRSAETATKWSDHRLGVMIDTVQRQQVPWADVAVPVGTIEEPIQSGRGAWVIGSTGRLADADLGTREGRQAAIAALDAQAPTGKKGRPVEHLGHLVLPIPHGSDGKPVREHDPVTGMRAARQAMLAIGADPELHDAIVVRHSKEATKHHAAEECLHVVWSRINNETGLVHNNEHEWVSLALGQLRWRNASGARMDNAGASGRSSDAVADAIKKLEEGKHLYARYKGGASKKDDIGVRITDEAWMARIGAEGAPEVGTGSGELWLSKKKTRDAHGLLNYLFTGA